jgi:hypothetical protein
MPSTRPARKLPNEHAPKSPRLPGRPAPAAATGVIDHMAFTASDLKAIKARFDERGLRYDLRRQAGAGTWQLFSFDPNGAKVELDFDGSEQI